MEEIDSDTVQAGIFKVRMQNSPMTVDVTEESKVPNEFKEEMVTVRIDKKAIVKHIKSTGEIPDGVFPVQGKHIRIY